MKTNLLKFKWLFILLVGMTIVSCSKNESADDATAESYAEETVFRTQEAVNMGKFGCYELVFPVSISFSDGTSIDIDSYEALKKAIQDWRKNNPKVRTRPSIAFPYQVINADGELITVETVEQQRELRAACGKDFFGTHGPGGHNDRPKLCFKLTYPYSVTLPDSTVVTIKSKEDRKTLEAAIKEWRKNNPGSKARAELVYPVTVEMEDGTLVTVANKEELKALKASCK